MTDGVRKTKRRYEREQQFSLLTCIGVFRINFYRHVASAGHINVYLVLPFKTVNE